MAAFPTTSMPGDEMPQGESILFLRSALNELVRLIKPLFARYDFVDAFTTNVSLENDEVVRKIDDYVTSWVEYRSKFIKGINELLKELGKLHEADSSSTVSVAITRLNEFIGLAFGCETLRSEWLSTWNRLRDMRNELKYLKGTVSTPSVQEIDKRIELRTKPLRELWEITQDRTDELQRKLKKATKKLAKGSSGKSNPKKLAKLRQKVDELTIKLQREAAKAAIKKQNYDEETVSVTKEYKGTRYTSEMHPNMMKKAETLSESYYPLKRKWMDQASALSEQQIILFKRAPFIIGEVARDLKIPDSFAENLAQALTSPAISPDKWNTLLTTEWDEKISPDVEESTFEGTMTDLDWKAEKKWREEIRAHLTRSFYAELAKRKFELSRPAYSYYLMGKIREFVRQAKLYEVGGLMKVKPYLRKKYEHGHRYMATNIVGPAFTPIPMTELSMPTSGYESFKVYNNEMMNTFDEFMQSKGIIDEDDSRKMIETLTQLKIIIIAARADRVVMWYSACPVRAYHGTKGGHRDFTEGWRTLSASELIEHMDLAITMLSEEDPDLNGYKGLIYDGDTSGYELRTFSHDEFGYVNPFRFSPTYLFMLAPGGRHIATKKQVYWVEIETATCDDGDCVYAALQLTNYTLASAPDEEMRLVKESLNEYWSSHGEEFERSSKVSDSTLTMLRNVMKPITTPWFVVNSVCENGTWKVIASNGFEDSQDTSKEVRERKRAEAIAQRREIRKRNRLSDVKEELPNLVSVTRGGMSPTPAEFAAHKGEWIGLFIYRGHMFRITGLNGTVLEGWTTVLDGQLVRLENKSTSGFGSKLVKLLTGTERLMMDDRPCVGSAFTNSLDGKPLMSFDDLEWGVINNLSALVKDRRQQMNMVKYMSGVDYEEDDCDDAESYLGADEEEEEVVDPRESISDAELLDLLTKENEANLAKSELSERSWEVRLTYKVPILVKIRKTEEGYEVISHYGVWDIEFVLENLDTFIVIEAYTLPEEKASLKKASKKEKYGRIWDHTLATELEEGVLTCSVRDSFTVVRFEDAPLASIVKYCYASEDPGWISDEQAYNFSTAFEELCQGTGDESVDPGTHLPEDVKAVLITNAQLSEGRKMVDFAYSHGKVHKSEVYWVESTEKYQDKPKLIKLWQDPDGTLWVIAGINRYTCRNVLKELTGKTEPILGAFDTETWTKDCATEPVMVSYNLMGLEKGYFDGTSCMTSFVQYLERMMLKHHDQFVIVSFNGALFDNHFLLTALCASGGFFKHSLDSHNIVGNKIMELIWRGRMRFIDLRRFTQGALSTLGVAMNLDTCKASANHELVQKYYVDTGFSFPKFKGLLSSLPPGTLLKGLDKCRPKGPEEKWSKADRSGQEFLDKISSLNGYTAYALYCQYDTDTTLEAYKVMKAGLQAIPEFLRTTTEVSSFLVESGKMTLDELIEELKKVTNPDNSCSGPSLAYKIHSASQELFPIINEDAAGKVFREVMPKATTLDEERKNRRSLIGGDSFANFSDIPPTLITENHSVKDDVSLFPHSAMNGSMPCGERTAITCFSSLEGVVVEVSEPKTGCMVYDVDPDVLAIGDLEARVAYVDNLLRPRLTEDAPINKHGVYECLILGQPGYVAVPLRVKDRPLNWVYHGPFCTTLTHVMIDLTRWCGAKLIVLEGRYWPRSTNPGDPSDMRKVTQESLEEHEREILGMFNPPYECNGFFRGSLMLWRLGKMEQDNIKERCVDILGEMKVATSEAEMHRLADELEELTQKLSPALRYIFKLLSNALLGKFAQRLRTTKIISASNSMDILEKLKDAVANHTDIHSVHHLSYSPDKVSTLFRKVEYDYEGPALITIDTDPADKFKDEHPDAGVKESLISTTMLSWAHTQMVMGNLRTAYLANSIRGIETDGVHDNDEVYCEYIRKTRGENQNPYWIDGPIREFRKLKYNSAHEEEFDGIYALGDAGCVQASYMSDIYRGCSRIGDFRINHKLNKVSVGAKAWAKAHGQPEDFPPNDYGYYTFEGQAPGPCTIMYPFCKFYRIEVLKGDEVVDVITKSKGISRHTKNGEALVREECGYPAQEKAERAAWLANGKSLKGNDLIAFQKHLSTIRHARSTQLYEEAPSLMVLRPGQTDASALENLVLSRSIFESIGSGHGIDIVEWRFEGALTIANSDRTFTSEVQTPMGMPRKTPKASPISHRFTTKRIAPHSYFHLTVKDKRQQTPSDYQSPVCSISAEMGYHPERTEFVAFYGARLTHEEVALVCQRCKVLKDTGALYELRGFTFEFGGLNQPFGVPRNVYVSPAVIHYLNKHYSGIVNGTTSETKRRTKRAAEEVGEPSTTPTESN